MVNQTGDFFAAFPDQEQALLAIAAHLQRFREPRMRTGGTPEWDST